jgi:hypothetical protein
MDLQLKANMPGMLPGFDDSKDVVDVQFIGHSRGGVVISEALQDLNNSNANDPGDNFAPGTLPHWLSAGYPMMTMLDPHPANNNIWPTPISSAVGTNYGSLSDAFDTLYADPSTSQVAKDAMAHLAAQVPSPLTPVFAPLPALTEYVRAYNTMTSQAGGVTSARALDALLGYLIVGPVRAFQAQGQDDDGVVPSNVRIAEEYYQNSSSNNAFHDDFEHSVNLWGEDPLFMMNQLKDDAPFYIHPQTNTALPDGKIIGHGEVPIDLYAGYVQKGGIFEFYDSQTGAAVRFPYTLSLLHLQPFTDSGDPLEVTTQPPANVTSGSRFGLVVTAEYDNGAVNTSFNGAVTLSLMGAQGSGALGGKLTVNAVHGVAVFTGLTLSQAGSNWQIVATTPNVPSAVTNLFSVSPAPPRSPAPPPSQAAKSAAHLAGGGNPSDETALAEVVSSLADGVDTLDGQKKKA